ncbi:MAG: spermidine/putrescine ABC transporter substrate-binding protein [Candidatus Marinimicrobia bacterium]|nr:spermidine/putrescine ABC transporter substrate-binding protein [Candidatus Neomarinimicrobiota bacterium]
MLYRILSVVLLTILIYSCSSKEEAALNVYNWSDYIDPAVVKDFEDKYQVKVIYDTFASNEELLAKLEGGAQGYDVIFPSDYMVEIMIEEDILANLDHTLLPHLSSIDSKFLNPPFDPGSKHSVAFTYGTSGIGYNTSEVAEEIDSWGAFWNPKYAGRILLLDDMREVFGLAFKYLGYSVNDTDPAHLEEAKQLLIQQKEFLLKYESSMNKDLLLNREALLSHFWAGDMYQVIDEDSVFAFTIPREGAVLFTDCMAIPKNAPHKELAHKFIDHILTPEVAGKVINEIWYAMPIPEALQYVDEEIRTDGNIFPPPEILDRCEFLTDLGDYNAVMDRAWSELKLK